MDQDSIQHLKEIKDIDNFIEFITPFYPNFSVQEMTIEEIEGALFNSYINLVGQVIVYSPETMRSFLKKYLLKFEIRNIKQAIIDTILGTPLKEKRRNINQKVEELLDHKEFMNDLVEIRSLDEIQLFMKNTRYNKAIREGILYFRNNNELFVLEAFLDKLYYSSLLDLDLNLDRKEKELINPYINLIIEIYNLITIHRGITNNIEKELLKQFIVDHYLFLDGEILQTLLNKKSKEQFFSTLKPILTDDDSELKSLINIQEMKEKSFEDFIKNLYYSYYFNKFKRINIDDIERLTIFRIMRVILKKEREIRTYILPKVVKILHQNYYSLKEQLNK